MISKTSGHAIAVELTTGEKFLIVQVDIECGACGLQHFQFCGRHARALRDWLIEVIDQHPDLTGKDEEVTRISHDVFEGRPSSRPEDN